MAATKETQGAPRGSKSIPASDIIAALPPPLPLYKVGSWAGRVPVWRCRSLGVGAVCQWCGKVKMFARKFNGFGIRSLEHFRLRRFCVADENARCSAETESPYLRGFFAPYLLGAAAATAATAKAGFYADGKKSGRNLSRQTREQRYAGGDSSSSPTAKKPPRWITEKGAPEHRRQHSAQV